MLNIRKGPTLVIGIPVAAGVIFGVQEVKNHGDPRLLVGSVFGGLAMFMIWRDTWQIVSLFCGAVLALIFTASVLLGIDWAIQNGPNGLHNSLVNVRNSMQDTHPAPHKAPPAHHRKAHR